MTTPKRDRPRLPAGYISPEPKGMLTWAATERILKTFPYLWIATVNDDGRPLSKRACNRLRPLRY